MSQIFGCFEKFLAYTLFLPSFIVLRHQMVELNWGEGLFGPLSIIGVSRTSSKIGLKSHFKPDPQIKADSPEFFKNEVWAWPTDQGFLN